MEDNLIKDKWYKLNQGKQGVSSKWYGKFSHIDSNGIMTFSEAICDGKFWNNRGTASFGRVGDYNYTEDISEILHLLPNQIINQYEIF